MVYVLTSTPGTWYLRYAPAHFSDEQICKAKHIFMSYLSPIHYNSLTYQDGSYIVLSPYEVAKLPELCSDIRRVSVSALHASSSA